MAIKLLIFDLDGVLVNTSKLHLEALNAAIATIDPQFCISDEEDLKYFGTIPSKEKLKVLSKLKNFPLDKHEEVLKLKKIFTQDILNKTPTKSFFNNSVKQCIVKLSKKYTLHIASNTNYKFINDIISRIGLDGYFSNIFSNEDVNNPKPHPEIYLKSFLVAGVAPHEAMIFEDSINGQSAAIQSGAAYVYGVEDFSDLQFQKIENKIKSLPNKPVRWKNEKTNVVIPMAGEGSRFKNAGFVTPKPIIDVLGMPMVGLVVDQLNIDANFVFIVKDEHCREYNLETILNLMVPGCKIVKTYGKQSGSASSILAAEDIINNDNHLVIANADQIWDWNSNLFYYTMISENLDGGIVTFTDPDKDPKWSFAKIDELGYVTEVAEKKPISDLATAGIYYFKKGSDFVKYAKQMIAKDIRVNNEFYTCPVYNEAILDGKKIKTFNIERMWGLGTPEDLSYFNQHYHKK